MGRSGLRLEGFQIGHGLGGFGGRGKDRALVLPKDAKPVSDILGMIGAHLGGDAKLRHHNAGGDFRDEFLEAVRLVTEFLAEFAVQAVRGAAPMRSSCRSVAA